jgi:DNA-directed RNA polymerase specialized sigma24 family protein
MTTAHFYQHSDRYIPRIQSFASELAKDSDTARFLYIETAHQASKNQIYLEQETFEGWLINTMRNTYNKMVQGI